MDLTLDRQSREPLYRQLRDQLRTQILAGALPGGTRLPPERELAEQLAVNRGTVLSAYRDLKAQGLLRARVGSGTVVAAPGEARHGATRRGAGARDAVDEAEAAIGAPASLPWSQLLRRDATAAQDPLLRDLLALSERPDILSLAVGLPAPDLLPLAAVRAAYDRVLGDLGPAAFLHSPTEGVTSLREALAGLMAERGAPCDAAELMVTSGSQQALDLVARVLIEPGDAVVVEEPSFFGALQAFRRAGARLLGVPSDADGLRVDLLGDLLERHRPKLIYTLPTYQNPSGSVLAPARRERLLALAARHQVPVVEDDPYSDLGYDGPPVPPLKALDRAGQVVYLSSFSKTLFPGLRLGWVAAPAVLVRALVMAKQTLDLHSNTLGQHLVDRLIRDGAYAAHLAAVRPAYAARRDALDAALRAGAPPALRWERPRGGYYLWCRLDAPVSPARLLAAAGARGVAFLPGAACFPAEPPAHYLRLNFSHPTLPRIRDGAGRLLAALQEALASPESGPRAAGGTPPIV